MSELGERMIPVPLNDAAGRGKLVVFTRNLETLENSESLSATESIDRRQRSTKFALEVSRHNLA